MRFRERPCHKGVYLALTGLAALVLVMPSLVYSDECPDAWITAKVKSRLFGKGGLGAFKVNIDTEQCVVTLQGCVDTEETRSRATEQARKVSKVRDVQNNLTLCPKAESEEKECADALITAEVKSMLMGTTGFSAFKINIDTEECVVTLQGCVDTAARVKTAARTAGKAKGVRSVRNELKICGG